MVMMITITVMIVKISLTITSCNGSAPKGRLLGKGVFCLCDKLDNMPNQAKATLDNLDQTVSWRKPLPKRGAGLRGVPKGEH